MHNKTITKLLIMLLVPFFVNGQGLLSSNESLTISMSPSSPGPNKTITLTVVSNSTGLENSLITWSENDVVKVRGVGEINYRIKTGRVGSSKRVDVTVLKDSGESLQESIIVRPAEVSLIWEADSYTPPFYRGKGLPSHQAKVKVVAIPNFLDASGRKISSESLSYEWWLDGKVNQSQSGFGRNIFNFKGPLVSRPQTVSLFVESGDGLVSANKNIVLEFVEPKILVYKRNPLTGIRSSLSLDLGLVEKDDSTFVAEPYFFSEEAFKNNLLSYNWRVDGESLEGFENRRQIIFSGDTPGSSFVSVSISNPINLLEIAKSLFRVIVSSDEAVN